MSTTEEINTSSLHDQARSLIETDIKKAESIINLTLLTEQKNLTAQITSLSIKSFILLKSKQNDIESSILRIVNKVIKAKDKYLKENNLILIRIFSRSANILNENKKIYVAIYCLIYAALLIETLTSPESQDIKDKIMEMTNDFAKILNKNVFLIEIDS